MVLAAEVPGVEAGGMLINSKSPAAMPFDSNRSMSATNVEAGTFFQSIGAAAPLSYSSETVAMTPAELG